jgi:hypothetical protein
MGTLARKLPLPIDVTAGQIGPVVAADHSVYIHHRHYLELILVPQLLRLLRRTQKEVYHALHNERSWRLAWMLPTDDVDEGFDLFLVGVRGWVGDGEKRDMVTHSRQADVSPVDVPVLIKRYLNSRWSARSVSM